MNSLLTRRSFLGFTIGMTLGTCAHAQTSIAHANVAELDRDNILLQAKALSQEKVNRPISPDLYSETEPTLSTAGLSSQIKLHRIEINAFRELSATVATLCAAYLLTRDSNYAQIAIAHLNPWLVAPETRLKPSFDRVGCLAGTTTATPAGIVDLTPLAELARALSFLADALSPEALTQIETWFTEAARWLDTNKQAFIAREAKDHRGSAHLLVTVAIARFLRDENTLEACRKRFRGHTLRNQIHSDGVFPQEVATPNPYRNTLFNFDLLGGACQLLSSQFESAWDYELIDGVGMRVVAAYLYPVIAQPERWGFPADARYFRDLPGRRPALLFCGRAYNRPEYVDVWRSTPAEVPAALADTFPIRQPALWTARAPHGR